MLVPRAGLGLLFVPLNLVGLHRVWDKESGIASSLLNAGQQDVSQALTATQIAKMHRRAEIAQLARDVKRTRRWGPAAPWPSRPRDAQPPRRPKRAALVVVPHPLEISPRHAASTGVPVFIVTGSQRERAGTFEPLAHTGFDTDGRRAHDRQMEHPRR